MKRELRYIVVKINDANKYLSPAERDTLERLSAKCALGRIDDGKRLLECVCVESDWPEYEPTWAAIAARMDGAATPTPDEGRDKCEGCDKPATHHDSEGVPLCKECFDELPILPAEDAGEDGELLDIMDEIDREALHDIPAYAYGNNQAACEMAGRLGRISEAVDRLRRAAKSNSPS